MGDLDDELAAALQEAATDERPSPLPAPPPLPSEHDAQIPLIDRPPVQRRPTLNFGTKVSSRPIEREDEDLPSVSTRTSSERSDGFRARSPETIRGTGSLVTDLPERKPSAGRPNRVSQVMQASGKDRTDDRASKSAPSESALRSPSLERLRSYRPVTVSGVVGSLDAHLAWMTDEQRAELKSAIDAADFVRAHDQLVRLQERYPKNLTIKKAIAQFRAMAMTRLEEVFGGLHVVPRKTRSFPLIRAPERAKFAALIDGAMPIEGVLRRWKQDRLRGMEMLNAWFRVGGIEIVVPAHDPPQDTSSEPMTTSRSVTPLALSTSSMSSTPPAPVVERRLSQQSQQRVSSSRYSVVPPAPAPAPKERALRSPAQEDEDDRVTELPRPSHEPKLSSVAPGARTGTRTGLRPLANRSRKTTPNVAVPRFMEEESTQSGSRASQPDDDLPAALDPRLTIPEDVSEARKEASRPTTRPPPPIASESSASESTTAARSVEPPRTSSAPPRMVPTAATTPRSRPPVAAAAIAPVKPAATRWGLIASAVAMFAVGAGVVYVMLGPTASTTTTTGSAEAAKTGPRASIASGSAKASAIPSPFSALGSAPNSGSPNPNPTTSASPDPSTTAPNGSTVQLTFDVEPRFAALYIDGKKLPPKTKKHALPRDNDKHELRVEAVGFKKRKLTFTADADTRLVVSLEILPMPSVVPTSSASSKPMYEE